MNATNIHQTFAGYCALESHSFHFQSLQIYSDKKNIYLAFLYLVKERLVVKNQKEDFLSDKQQKTLFLDSHT